MVLLNNNKYRNYLKLNSGPQHPAAHGITMRFNATASRADLGKNKLKYLEKVLNFLFYLFLLSVACLGLWTILEPIFSSWVTFGCFKYCLVYNKKIIIHNLWETIFTVFSFFGFFWAFIDIIKKEKTFKRSQLWILLITTIFILGIFILVNLVPEMACCVSLTENLQIIKIPTIDQFNDWSKRLFQRDSINFKHSFEHYEQTSQNFYSNVFDIKPNFKTGTWQFNNIELIKTWPERYFNEIQCDDLVEAHFKRISLENRISIFLTVSFLGVAWGTLFWGLKSLFL